jgi:KDO2-lipid IV(A) lauroyltransferase
MNEYSKYRLAKFLSRSLPHGLAYWLGLRFADRFYSKRRQDREAVMSNLKRIFEARGIAATDERLESVARKTFQHFGKYLVDFFRYARLTREEMSHLVSIEHPEYLEEAVSKGRGVLVVTGHVGNWELAGAVMVALGHDVNAVVLPERMQKLDKLVHKERQRRGMKPIPLGRAVVGIVHALRRGEMVALVADRDFSPRNDRITFFGEPARLPSGPARLAMITKAPILPMFLLREVDDTFLFKFYPPIYAEEMGSEEAIKERIREILEEVIAENPHQWFIFDDFWADGDRAVAEKRVGATRHGDGGE